MKVWVALLLLVVHQSFTQNVTILDILHRWKEQVAPSEYECVSETGVNQMDIDEYYEEGKLSNNANFKCYLYCHGSHAHIYTARGEIDPETLAKNFDYIDLELAQKCAMVKNRRNCQKGYLLVKCLVDDLSKRYPA